MRAASICSNVNIEEKEIKYKPDNLIMVSRWHNKKVSCLKCGKKFIRESPYNRICEKCNLINDRIRATTYSLSLKFAEITDYL